MLCEGAVAHGVPAAYLQNAAVSRRGRVANLLFHKLEYPNLGKTEGSRMQEANQSTKLSELRTVVPSPLI